MTRLRAVLALLALAPGAARAAGCTPHGGATIITVAGALAQSNRGGNTPADQFVTHQGHKFDRAMALDADAIAALPLADLMMVLPYDGVSYQFTGPRLRAVLDAAGLGADGVTVSGIDGYHVEYSSADLAAHDPILAVCRNGRMLGIGDLGPAFVVFPPAAKATPNDEEFAKMVWGVYLLTPLPPN